MHRIVALCLACLLAAPGAAQDGPVTLFAPQALRETGLMQHILPRFTLKTQVRVTVVDDPAAAELVLGPRGTPLFRGAGALWHLRVADGADADAARFADWLTGDIGRRTVLAFAPDGTPLFVAPEPADPPEVTPVVDGDADRGHAVARRACRRCHAVDAASRFSSIGSTPSFRVLRGLDDWRRRFAQFHALNPHPAFTYIPGVAQPDPARPSPIAPITVTGDELAALIAYVAGMEPADLGAPLAHQ